METRTRMWVWSMAMLIAGLGLQFGCDAKKDSRPPNLLLITKQAGDDRLYGFITTKGEIVIEPRFLSATEFHGGASRVNIGKGKDFGTIDTDGNYLNRYEFDLMDRNYAEGVAAVDEPSTGKWGFLDKAGKIVIDRGFKAVKDFSDGLAAAQDSDGQWGFIDHDGKWAIKPQFANTDSFSEGFCAVATGNTYGFIDKSGNFLCRYTATSQAGTSDPLTLMQSFSDDLAAIAIPESGFKWGFIGKDGKIAIKPEFSSVSDFSEGIPYGAASQPPYNRAFIDKSGKPLIDGDWFRANRATFQQNFSEGLAYVTIGGNGDSKPSDVFIDRTGKTILEPTGIDMLKKGFVEGVATVGVGRDGETAYIDRAGKFIWRP